MNDILLLIISNQVLDFIDHKPLRSKWIVIMHVMKLFWILKIYRKNARNNFPVVKVTHPLETTNRKRLTHRPSIEIVCIKIVDVFLWLCFIIGFIHIFFVCLWKAI